MQQALAELDGVATVAVMPGTVELLSMLRRRLELTIPLLSDPDWELHHRFGMKRGSRRDIFLSVATWKAYARLFRDWKLTRPSEDVFQLGGVAVVAPDGVLAWIYRGRTPADYADPSAIVRSVRALHESPLGCPE